MTRTKGTEDFYEEKLKSICNTYVQDEIELSTRDGIIGIFNRIQVMTSTNTSKMYRSVLRWHCSKSQVELEDGDMKITAKPLRSRKMKGYSEADRIKVTEYIRASGWPNDAAKRFVELHLFIGPLLGYRIVEITNIKMEDENNKYKFIIENGKATNGRGNGETRWVRVPYEYDGVDLRDVMVELQSLYALPGMIESARKLHLKASEYVFRRNRKRLEKPTLSSTRHEFKMSASESSGSRECSGAMGHISIRTKERHYGKRNKGSQKHDHKLNEFHEKMEVSPENVMRVRDSLNPRVYESDKIKQKIK